MAEVQYPERKDEFYGGKAIVKPQNHLRRHPSVKALQERNVGYITDYGQKHQVQLSWGMNKNAHKENIFKISIGGNEAYIDLDELLFYTRMMV